MTDLSEAMPLKSVGVRQVSAVVIGNALEFYDFLIYGFFAAQIGRSLFPSGSHDKSLLLSLATFGAGFLTRPLGGIVIGGMADRQGRKPALLLSFSLMGLAIAGLALTPSSRLIGPAAGVIAVACRMVQGFALGGELGPSTAYLLEAAPARHRGLYVSFQFATQNASVLAAGLVGLALSSHLSPDALQAWGWRVAMLLGVVVVPIGWLLRRSLIETLPVLEPAPPSSRRSLGGGLAMAGLLLFGASTINVYVLNYLTTYAQVTLHMRANAAFGATIVLGLTSCLGALISGALSDRVGRKPPSLLAFALLTVLTPLAFAAMARLHTSTALLSATALLAALSALGNGPVMVLFTEAMPVHVRARSLSLIYAVSIAVFGGSAQLFVAWLTQVTGNPLAPAWYMSAAGAVAVMTLVFLKETAPKLSATSALAVKTED